MRLFVRLRNKLTYLPKQDIVVIYKAYLIAFKAHAGQKRGSGELYISHPLAVAGILADLHMDKESIMAALLHDVIEDTSVDKDAVTKEFGSDVAEIVDGVTKLSKMQFSSLVEAQAENLRKMILAMTQDIRVILVKLADRLHNMRTISGLPDYKRKRIAKETLDIYAPIANRLGMYEICIELEDLGFLALYPRRYKVLQNAVKKARGNRKSIINTISKAIKRCFARSPLTNVEIISREKHLYSIYRKMVQKRLSFAEVTDVYGFRVLVNSVDDCYRALGVVHSIYKPMPGKFKDYIAIPKINGYQSLHTALLAIQGIPIEIQIRTYDMDKIANKGIAGHWLYKSGELHLTDTSQVKAQQWLNDLLEMQQISGSSTEFMENVKIDLFPDEVYVFTPRGIIKKLMRGATPVDFAYEVHTDIGNTCVAAKIDHQFTPLSTELLNGQTVSIITAPGARPKPAWLTFVKTAKARSKIKQFLKTQKKTELIALGKQLLINALQDLSLSINDVAPFLNQLLKELKLDNVDALYESIGLGNRIAPFVAHQLLVLAHAEPATEESKKALEIVGTEGMAVSYAQCCNPIPGDTIVGDLVPGKGLLIHKEDCDTVAKLQEKPDRFVLVRWAENVKGEFLTEIHITVYNKPGAFAAIANEINDEGANIEDIYIKERVAEYYVLKIQLFVHNRLHLKQIMRRLESSKFVSKVVRV